MTTRKPAIALVAAAAWLAALTLVVAFVLVQEIRITNRVSAQARENGREVELLVQQGAFARRQVVDGQRTITLVVKAVEAHVDHSIRVAVAEILAGRTSH